MTTRAREIKLVLLGDSGVGKSSLVLRFVTQSFKPYSESTIGASFMSKVIELDGQTVKVGQTREGSLKGKFYAHFVVHSHRKLIFLSPFLGTTFVPYRCRFGTQPDKRSTKVWLLCITGERRQRW